MGKEQKHCTLYVDESGDLGICRGTRWFVITGVVILKDDEKVIRETLSSIKTKLNIKEIHLRRMNDFYKTSYVVSKIKDLPFVTINILLDTNKLLLKNSAMTYNHMCRFLVERASWYMRDNNLRGDIVFSSRGTRRDNELVTYIKELLDHEENKIAKVFENVKCKQASMWDMLQLADICATSMFRSYQINSWGFIVPCHMSSLKDKLYKHNKHVDKYGIKFYSDDMKPDAKYFEEHYMCKK